MICNLGDPMSLRHPVRNILEKMAIELKKCICGYRAEEMHLRNTELDYRELYSSLKKCGSKEEG